MEDKNFDFVMEAAMLGGASCGEVEKLRKHIRDVKTSAQSVEGEELCAPLSGKIMSPSDLRKPDENFGDKAGISQSGHLEGDSVRVPRVVA